MGKLSGTNLLFICILLATSAAASIFMIVESADFYARFYEGEQGKNFGLFASILNETFLVIMSAVWLPKIKWGGLNLLHPGNLFIKLLMVILFFNTVGGATFNVIEQNLEELAEQQRLIEILKIREEQLISTKKKLDVFIEQNQPANTAIAARELSEVQKSLVEIQQNTKSKTGIWIDIVVLTFLRISIQLSNITCIWIASWIYRQRNYKIGGIIHGLGKDLTELKNDIKHSIKKPAAPKSLKLATPQKSPKNLLTFEQNSDTKPENNLSRIVERPHDNLPSKALQASERVINKNVTKVDYNTNPNLMDEEAYSIKQTIRNILSGLSVQESESTLCQKLNLNYSEFKRLLNQNSNWSSQDIKKLVSIKNIIQRKFDQDASNM